MVCVLRWSLGIITSIILSVGGAELLIVHGHTLFVWLYIDFGRVVAILTHLFVSDSYYVLYSNKRVSLATSSGKNLYFE